jgi:hypothetical protein
MIGLAMALAALANSTSYDCTMEVPKTIARKGDAAEARQILFSPQLTPADWRFVLTLGKGEGGKGIDATITWAGDPIQLAGKHAALTTADGAIAFTTFSTGPCMFTESMCMSLVNMARQPDNTIKFIVLPAALATDRKANTRRPFVVISEGVCKERPQ